MTSPVSSTRKPRLSVQTAGGAVIKTIIMVAALVMMVGPLVVVIIASFTQTSYAVFPPQGWTLQWFVEAAQDSKAWSSTVLSLWMALVVAAVSTVLALSFGLAMEAISRERFFVRFYHRLVGGAAKQLIMLPVMFPGVVIAVAMLNFMVRRGLAGTPLAILIAHIVITLPFALVMVEVGLNNSRDDLRQSAESLGASAWRVLVNVTLPLAGGGIAAAFAFAFVISFGEVTAALFLQGPSTITIPVYMYNELYEQTLTATMTAISAFITIFTVLLVVVGMFVGRKAAAKYLAQ